MTKLHRSEWLTEIKAVMPELRDALNAEQGLLAFEMGVFTRFTQQKIAQNDHDTVERCFALALKYYEGGNTRLRDAIDTCYIEDLDFRVSKRTDPSWAWDLLPPALQTLHQAFHNP
ncbi:MAG: hypothetical protein AAF950_17840 [Pseudomonadota bacterium]